VNVSDASRDVDLPAVERHNDHFLGFTAADAERLLEVIRWLLVGKTHFVSA
jgi:hypothetical protein